MLDKIGETDKESLFKKMLHDLRPIMYEVMKIKNWSLTHTIKFLKEFKVPIKKKELAIYLNENPLNDDDMNELKKMKESQRSGDLI